MAAPIQASYHDNSTNSSPTLTLGAFTGGSITEASPSSTIVTAACVALAVAVLVYLLAKGKH